MRVFAFSMLAGRREYHLSQEPVAIKSHSLAVEISPISQSAPTRLFNSIFAIWLENGHDPDRPVLGYHRLPTSVRRLPSLLLRRCLKALLQALLLLDRGFQQNYEHKIPHKRLP